MDPRSAEAAPAPLQALKVRQQATWASGDYALIGTTLQIVGETLCEAVDLRAGQRVLDVAAGNGNAALAAARRGAEVTASDYVPELLAHARRRAEAERLPLLTELADAEALPAADGSYDVLLSTFGVMFTADHPRAAAELLRVCRPGGVIGLANWTPEGYIGQLLRLIGRHLPPPPAAQSPTRWGERAVLEGWFGAQAQRLTTATRVFTFRYRSPAHWLEVFGTWYGPLLKALGALTPEGQAALRGEVLDLIARHNRADDGSLVLPSEYLEVVIQRR